MHPRLVAVYMSALAEEVARQPAGRARRRVRGAARVRDADRAVHRDVVDALLVAACGGDFRAFVAVLDHEVVLRVDRDNARRVPLLSCGRTRRG
jgi:hypothetical protein